MLFYFWGHGISFSFLWFGIYLLLSLGTGAFFMLVFYLALKLTGRSEDEMDSFEATSGRRLSVIKGEIIRRPWHILLIPGEDGLFFLPLLYIGINPFSALCASLLFGFAHITYKPAAACMATSVTAFFICIFILPHGIFNIVLGHVLVDITVFFLIPRAAGEDASAACISEDYPDDFT